MKPYTVPAFNCLITVLNAAVEIRDLACKARRDVEESGTCILHQLLNHQHRAPLSGCATVRALPRPGAGCGAEAGRATRLTRRAGGYPGAATRPPDPAWWLPPRVGLGLATSQRSQSPCLGGSLARPPLVCSGRLSSLPE
eukprot:scaffold78838_cov58-Phaeocystis_antarctica.AAC.1